MATPSIPFIRPLTLGELLDQAIRLYRRNFLNFIVIIAIPIIPLMLIQTGLSYLLTDSLTNVTYDPSSPYNLPSAYWLRLLSPFFLLLIRFILINGVAAAALTRAVADNYTGNPVGILESYRNDGSSWGRMFGALFLLVLITIPVFIWAIIPCIGWLGGLGLFVFMAIVVSSLLAPVVVLERHGVAISLRRAWDFGRSRFWWLLGFAFILFLFSQLVVTGPATIINLLMSSLLGAQMNLQQLSLLNSIIQFLIGTVTAVLYYPLSLTATTLVYFDLRVRSEGLDLALQAAAESNTEINIVTLAETSPQPTGSLINGTDVAQFLLLSLAIVAVGLILISVFYGLALLLVAGFS